MGLNVKYDSFQQVKEIHQHYYVNYTWEENKNPEIEFEGSRYRVDFQMAEDGGVPIKYMRLDLYPTAREICGGRSVNRDFLNALKKAVEEAEGNVSDLEAVPLRYGETCDLGGERLKVSISYMEVRLRLKNPFSVETKNGIFPLNYEGTVRFAVTKVV